ncbi:MAG TPA: HDOD domain-containing protein [Phycisphaerales bacterium]|nr:HDOD domain-containing protein [Phycisphaerales bacterium]
MSAPAVDNAPVVAKAIAELGHIATLPEITLKIVELVEDQTSTAQDLHNVIANDPALCSRILKVVNSSFYGLPGQIGSINRAIVLLGLNAVKNIAISASLAKLYRGGELCPSFSARDLWKHSIATAATSKLIGDELGLNVPDEAFLAGLIHDIGIMVELQFSRQKLIEIFARVDPEGKREPKNDMREAEQSILGANHQQFGKGLSDKWKFPRTFAAVTGGHHNPLDLPEADRTLPALVYVADRITATLPDGFRLDLTSLDFDPAVLDVLKLTHEQIEKVRSTLNDQLADVEALLT